jgi:hypothetical protein
LLFQRAFAMGAILRGSLLGLVKGYGEIRGCFAAMRRVQKIVINRASTAHSKLPMKRADRFRLFRV